MDVSLSPELEHFISSRVASGRYHTPSEVVQEGLRLLAEQEHSLETDFKSIKEKLDRAAGQADRGEVTPGEQVFEEIRQRSAARQKGRA